MKFNEYFKVRTVGFDSWMSMKLFKPDVFSGSESERVSFISNKCGDDYPESYVNGSRFCIIEHMTERDGYKLLYDGDVKSMPAITFTKLADYEIESINTLSYSDMECVVLYDGGKYHE